MSYTFTKYSAGGASEEEVVQIVKTNFEGGVGYETKEESVIVPETTVGESWASETPIIFTVNENYTVVLNGTTYSCIGKETTFDGDTMSYIGNASPLGLEDTGEPFVIATFAGVDTEGLFLSASENTFSVSGLATTINKISSKFYEKIGWSGSGVFAEIFNNQSNIASGQSSHAEGETTTASGSASHAEGETTTASGSASHAEGFNTTASGVYSHAEGALTIASGQSSHAEGETTTASGAYSHAEGISTQASSRFQHAQGKYNIEDTEEKYAHIVGNGTGDTSRSNAHTLDWSGNAWYAGTVEGTALILASSTEGSTKRFKITVDDSGTLTATEITE